VRYAAQVHRFAILLLHGIGAATLAASALACADTTAWHAQMLDAVVANGAYTLGCPREQVHASTLSHPGKYGTTSYFADGCGQRVMYEVVCDRGAPCRFEMTGRFNTTPGSPAVPPAPSAPATPPPVR
jgi:hypothetical protein